MAHELESMFYVKETPWHGLGTRLDEAPMTVEEAIAHAGLDWGVRVEPLYYKAPNGNNVPVPSSATVRDSDESVLGVVSPGYTPLQNADAFKWFQPFLDKGELEFETAGALRSGKHVWILARITGEPGKITSDDIVRKYLLLSNGHDGSMSASVSLCPIRVVCANTLAVALNDGVSARVRDIHTAKVKETLDMIRDAIDLANRQFSASMELYSDLAKRDINPTDFAAFVKLVFGKKHKSPEVQEVEDRKVEKITEDIQPLFEKGRGNDLPGVKGTWWAAYSSITEYLSYYRGRGDDRRLDSLWFGQGGSFNRRALSKAKELAFA